MNLNEKTIIQAISGLKNKDFTSTELVLSCLNRIKQIDNQIHAFITVCEDQALKAAKQADQEIEKFGEKAFEKKPLLGIPVAIKDNFCTKNIKTTAGSKVLNDYLPQYDATVIKKLKNSGTVILGKTNMDAWAHGSSTETSAFFTTKNPHNHEYLPGGSSGGSAAAVAAHECIFAIGSETAGSIRQPAAWCGTVGLKPTYGRVSRYGVIAMCSSTDCPGPLTKSIEDAALVLQVLAGKDKKDATTLPSKVEKYYPIEKKATDKTVIGVPKEYFLKGLDPEITAAVKNAIQQFKKSGAKIKEVSLLDPKYSIAVYTIVQRAEVSSNLARFDGIRYGENRSNFGKEAKRRIMLGTYALSTGYYDQYYNKAQKVRNLICKDFERVFKEVDLLISPVSPSPALKIGASEGQAMFGEMQDVLVEASSLAGLPGISIPCGKTKNDLPLAFQLFGPQLSERKLLNTAIKYEQE